MPRGVAHPRLHFLAAFKIDGAIEFLAAGVKIADDAEKVLLEFRPALVGLIIARNRLRQKQAQHRSLFQIRARFVGTARAFKRRRFSRIARCLAITLTKASTSRNFARAKPSMPIPAFAAIASSAFDMNSVDEIRVMSRRAEIWQSPIQPIDERALVSSRAPAMRAQVVGEDRSRIRPSPVLQRSRPNALRRRRAWAGRRNRESARGRFPPVSKEYRGNACGRIVPIRDCRPHGEAGHRETDRLLRRVDGLQPRAARPLHKRFDRFRGLLRHGLQHRVAVVVVERAARSDDA